MIHGRTHFGREFDVADWSQIDGDLYVGACGWGGNVLDVRESFVDSIENEVPDTIIEGLADQAERLMENGPVLICCTAGINRSPLVAARVLMRRGRTADEAISLLRARRGDIVLCNPTFEAWLHGVPA